MAITLNGNGTIEAVNGDNAVALTSDGAIEIRRDGGGAYIDFKDADEDYDARIQANSAGDLTLTGRVTMPNQVLFAATGNWAQTTFAQGTRINMDTLMVARTNNYDTSIGRFTAPVDGVYRFSANIYCYDGAHNSIVLRINGAEPAWTGDTMLLMFQPASAQTSMRSGTLTYQLSAGDYVELYQRNGSGNASLYGRHSSFSGYLVA